MKTYLHTFLIHRCLPLLCLLCLGCINAAAQDDLFSIKIKVIIVESDAVQKDGVETFIHEKKGSKYIFRGVTDNQGTYTIKVRPGTVLVFSNGQCEKEQKTINEEADITVKLRPKTDYNLKEAEAKARHKKTQLKAKPSRPKVSKGEITAPVSFLVPNSFNASDRRWVFQQRIINLSTQKSYWGRPYVVDNSDYHFTQDRMYSFDMEHQDSLGKYSHLANDLSVKKDKKDDKDEKVKGYKKSKKDYGDFLVEYTDTFRLKNTKDSYLFVVTRAAEDYFDIITDKCGTDTTAFGIVNPLRFLKVNYDSREIEDPKYWPKSIPELHGSTGEVNLIFKVGRTELDLSNETNALELSRMTDEIQQIMRHPDNSLHAIKITGTASPEGNYEHNLKLAKGRLQTAKAKVKGLLSGVDMTGVKWYSDDAKVAGWDEVADLLRKDSLLDYAETIQAILERFPDNVNQQGQAIRNLGFYNELLDKYLPRLRKVNYKLEYNVYRDRTKEEIAQAFKADPQSLSEYEYHTLYRSMTDDKEKEPVMRIAHDRYKNSWVIANDLQALLIRQKKPEVNILKRFADEMKQRQTLWFKNSADSVIHVSEELIQNHTIALLHNEEYEEATIFVQLLKADNPTNRFVKAMTALYGEYYDEALPEIRKTGTFNEILVYLAMDTPNDDKKAYELTKSLKMDEAVHYYIKATCLERFHQKQISYKEESENVDNVLSIACLEKAFEMDPSLENIAKGDNDIINLYKKLVNKRNEKAKAELIAKKFQERDAAIRKKAKKNKQTDK